MYNILLFFSENNFRERISLLLNLCYYAYTGKFMSRPFISASTCALYYAHVIISQKYIVPLFNRLAQLDAAARYNFLQADKRLQTSHSRQPCATRP